MRGKITESGAIKLFDPFTNFHNSPLDSVEYTWRQWQITKGAMLHELLTSDKKSRCQILNQYCTAVEAQARRVDDTLSPKLTKLDRSKYGIRMAAILDRIGIIKQQRDRAQSGAFVDFNSTANAMGFLEAYLKGLVYTVNEAEEIQNAA